MTNWTGKLVGGIIGLILYRPYGFFLGVLLGHIYDTHFAGRDFGNTVFRTQQVFFDSTFLIMGHLAKSDGRVSENEIAAAKRIMSFMGLTEARKKLAIKQFNKGKQPNFKIGPQLELLRTTCAHRPALLKIFLDVQLQVAYADGVMTPAKRRVLEHVCRQLGVAASFSNFEDQFRAEQNYYHHSGASGHQRASSYSRDSDINQAFKVLGISPTSNQADVKKAYRKQMSENHPDKLMAKGLPEDMIKVATEKTQQIKKAYEQICAAKGWQ